MVSSQFDRGVNIIGPVRAGISLQAQANQGFDIPHFVVDTGDDGKPRQLLHGVAVTMNLISWVLSSLLFFFVDGGLCSRS